MPPRLATRPRDDTWRVAMVVPLQGPAGLFGPSCEAITELAVHELNESGGILGRQVEAEVVDGGGTPARVAGELRRLVDSGRVDAVSGWHISSIRHALAPVVADRVPYVYTSLYEGGERRSGIFCTGETPRCQIEPPRWLRDHLGAWRWFVVGDDYVWPHRSTRAIRQYAKDLDLRLTGEAFVGLGAGDMSTVVREVEQSTSDGVLMLLVGQDAVRFNRAFAAHGLSDRLLRFSPLMEENMLLASGANATGNLYVSAAYFRSMVTADAMDLLGRYVGRHGPGAAGPEQRRRILLRGAAHAGRTRQQGGDVGASRAQRGDRRRRVPRPARHRRVPRAAGRPARPSRGRRRVRLRSPHQALKSALLTRSGTPHTFI